MTIILNRCYGGFRIPQPICEAWLYEPWDEIDRTDPVLVQFVQDNGGEYREGRSTRLVAVEIPAEATDWEIDEYDGAERITYVVGGRLYHA